MWRGRGKAAAIGIRGWGTAHPIVRSVRLSWGRPLRAKMYARGGCGEKNISFSSKITWVPESEKKGSVVAPRGPAR